MRRLWMIYGLTMAIGLDQASLSTAQASVADKERTRVSGPSSTRDVQLVIQRRGNVQTLEVRNDMQVPVNAVVAFSHLVNVAGVGRAPLQRLIPPGSQVRVATLRKRDPGLPMIYKHSFSYSVDYSPEPKKVGPVAGPAYELPWRGGPFRISQGAGGDFSHQSPKGRYAVDIAMPVGTPILAARAGKVIATRNNQLGRSPYPGGNFVRVLHDDGTHAAYLHLHPGTVRVKPGDRVEIGSLLGKSGNTGRSTGPHLHFVVQKEVDGELRSIPFRFTRPVDSLPNFAANDPR